MSVRKQKSLRSLLKNQSGTSIVEFAVISPVMFTLLMGGFDFGHTVYMKSVLQGAVNKAARDSSLETGTLADVQAAVDLKVTTQVHKVHSGVDLEFSRSYYRTFNDAAFPESEVWADVDGDGECNNDENYLDENNNSEFDEDGVADGQGYTRDAVKYTVTATYDRLFPFAEAVGMGSEVVMTANTVIANQPYGQKGAVITRKCENV